MLHRFAADRTQAVAVAQAQQTNLALIVSESLGQLLDSARMVAIASRDWWEGSPQDVADRLTAMRSAHPAFLRISLYDAAGARVYSSSNTADPPSWIEAVGDALQQAVDTDSSGQILTSASRRPEDAWHKSLLFRIGGAGAPPMGVLMVVLDLGYLLKVYQNIEFGASGVIHILTPDATELLEWRPEGLVLSSGPRRFEAFANPGAVTGSLNTDLFNDGRTHLSSFYRAARFPFILVVSRDLHEILAPVHRARSQSVFILGILSAIIALGTFFIVRSILRHEKLFDALAASDEKNRALIARLEDEKGRAFTLAAHDHLTGLLNRRTFNEIAASHLENAKRQRGHYALMYLDLDRFKLINDTLGHHVGDGLLRTVAARLQAALRKSDVVARLGGDEFAVLLTNLTSIDDLPLVAEKIIRQVSLPFQSQDGDEVQVSPSIGIAVFPRDGQDFESLCKNADAAMYESKRKGCPACLYLSICRP